ncbi:aquaporin [Shigella flexneri]
MATVYRAGPGSLADWSTDCGHWRRIGPIDGFAMNPARDFGPKVLPGWRAGAVCTYQAARRPSSWCRFFGPIVGAIVGALLPTQLISSHLPCDICVVEERKPQLASRQKASL